MLDTNKTISLGEILKKTSTVLVIQKNTLAYGVYEFKFVVAISFANGTRLSNSANTYIRIVPSGLGVFALPNGISSIVIGSQQSFTLNPAAYSIDIDNVISPAFLKYTFYCRTRSMATNQLASGIYMDLLEYENSQLPMASNQTCFFTNSNIYPT